jgi:hypothetical protein
MFFSNLKQMKRQCEILLDMDHDMVEDILDHGHDWAQDHISEAKNNMDQVFDFLMNETERDGMEMDVDNDMIMMKEEKKQELLFVQEVRHQQRQNMTCTPPLIRMDTLSKFVKEKSKDLMVKDIVQELTVKDDLKHF